MGLHPWRIGCVSNVEQSEWINLHHHVLHTCDERDEEQERKKASLRLSTSTCVFLLTDADNSGRSPLFLFYFIYSVVLFSMTGCHLSSFVFFPFFSSIFHLISLFWVFPLPSHLYILFLWLFFIYLLLPCITCCLCGHWMAADWFLCAAGDQSALYFPPHEAPGCHSRRPWHVLVPPPTKACTHILSLLLSEMHLLNYVHWIFLLLHCFISFMPDFLFYAFNLMRLLPLSYCTVLYFLTKVRL